MQSTELKNKVDNKIDALNTFKGKKKTNASMFYVLQLCKRIQSDIFLLEDNFSIIHSRYDDFCDLSYNNIYSILKN